jgi:hypothetical protein
MANEQNLIRNEDLTPEERRKRASKAGKKSVEARRKRKALKEELELLMQTKASNGKTYQEIMSTALVKQAIDGNTKAYEIIRDTLGEKPRDDVKITGELNNPFAGMSTEELRKILNE